MDQVGNIQIECSAGGVNRVINIGPFVNNVPTVIVNRYDGASMDGFIGGTKMASLACTGNISYPSSRGPAIGNYFSSNYGRSFNGQVFLAVLFPVALSDIEVRAISDNPWQIFAPDQRRIFSVVSGGSASTALAITTSDSVFSGSVNVSPLASLTLNTGLSIFNGIASSSAIATLDVSAESSTFSGTVTASPSASISINTGICAFNGVVTSSPFTSFSVLTNNSTIVGSATVYPLASASLNAASATFSGSISSSAVASASIVLSTSTAVFSGSAYVSPIALLSINTGLATFAGSALSAPTVSASLATANSIVAANITSSPRAALSVSTAPSVITGTGTGTVVTLSLTSVDLTAIADAVWNHSSALVMEAKLLEAWGRLGLDPTKPLVTDSTTITFGDIVMAMSEAPGSVTVTRQ
jgi:hypothetical protein